MLLVSKVGNLAYLEGFYRQITDFLNDGFFSVVMGSENCPAEAVKRSYSGTVLWPLWFLPYICDLTKVSPMCFTNSDDLKMMGDSNGRNLVVKLKR